MQKQQANVFKSLYYNKPQLEVYHLGANRTYCIWGRGTGKSSNALAPYFLRLVHEMPRGLFALVGSSYSQIAGRVLPSLIQGWERLGYKKNIHFFVRKYAPEKFKWKRSFFHPEESKHLIHFYTGAVIQFVSQDRPNLANGYNFDGMGGDEARFLNYDLLLELIPALRGNKVHFSDSSFHYAQMFTTDMPLDHRGGWLWDQEDQNLSPEKKKEILTLVLHLSDLQQKKLNAPQSQKNRYVYKIRQVEKALYYLRRDLVFFSTASTLENIYALGLKSIKAMEKTMSKHRFKTSVLNLREKKVGMGFYALFDPVKFGYYADNHDYLDSSSFIIGSERNCRWDFDFNTNKPLDLACDYGVNFNCCVVGQPRKNRYQVLNQFWAEYPLGIADVAEKLVKYYRFSKCKEINFYYDHTAYGKGITYLDEWIKVLTQNKWIVHKKDVGHTQKPQERYLLWHRTFNNDPELSKFSYNLSTCQDLETAIQLTGVRLRKGLYEKDKSTERRDGSGNFVLPQQHAPHLTDALDTLWVGTQFHKIDHFANWQMPTAITL